MIVIDHRDSFTWNLVAQLAKWGDLRVEEASGADRLDPPPGEIIILSPGPGCPSDYPATVSLFRRVQGTNPVIGVCLGFQIMVEAGGGRIVPQNRVLHGVQTEIAYRMDCRSYRGLAPPLYVGRYHSLQADPVVLPKPYVLTAWDTENDAPLSMEHPDLPLFGFQFHPDSFLTPKGPDMIANVIRSILES